MRALALLLVLAAPALAADVLVVAPAELQPALGAWRKHREAQGLAVEVATPGADVGAQVKAAHGASRGKLRFVLLVGDADEVPAATRPRQSREAVAAMERDPDIASDNPYADLDGDAIPDLAIGRVPADTVEEARTYLDRVVAYETSGDGGDWRRKLDVVAGTGGFGPVVDMAIEKLTRDLLERVPPSVAVTMTYAHPFSPYCPPPAEFADYAVRKWNEGALVVAYVGHGSQRSADRMRFGKETYPILGLDEVARIGAERGPPLSVFVACSTGQFDAPRDCLAEELLKRPKGPVAVIASSRVSTPYSNGVVAKELLEALFVLEAPTAGELLALVKRRLMDPPAADPMREQIEKLAQQTYEKSPEKRRADRADHLLLYNLLGDPCLRIARPLRAEVSAPASAAPGATIAVTCRAPFAGHAVVEVVRRRVPPPKLPPGGKKTAEEFRAAYEAAHANVVARAEARCGAEGATIEVTLPADAPPGEAAVRVYVTGETSGAAGSCALTIAAD